MPYADVNGLHLYYETEGQGRPLILLHGGLGTTDSFGPVRTELAKGRRVIAVDLQAHGRTADIDRPIHPTDLGRDIIALIEHLGLGTVDLMGYSLGAGAALWVAILRPDLVRRVVAVSTVARRNAFYPDILEQQQQMTAQAAEAMKGTPMHQAYASVAPRPDDWGRLFDKLRSMMARDMDFTNDLAKITVPVLFVQGDSDIVPPAHGVELFGLLGGGKRDGGWLGEGVPKSRLAVLPGLTHYAIGADPLLATVAIRFLDED
jgi:pimeloyl-ACP methyl ester carboxylesterase